MCQRRFTPSPRESTSYPLRTQRLHKQFPHDYYDYYDAIYLTVHIMSG